ncbi:class I SAM-dependent methyltransferase [Gymnodinialimonas hymeniacidonis]|uniref:class I SAM-dependent methyltransferase n=1 Tax=Gymnodinialimonas hymeniacidonis TaxID=3126508 RepID=UPI0034C62C8C
MDRSLQDVFEKKTWADEDKGKPRSGSGSTVRRTRRLRRALPGLFQDLGVKTFLDAPCGDWTWMAAVDLTGIKYIGGDISKELVDEVKAAHGGTGRRFMHLDLATDKLPKCDLIMVRECLIHLTDDFRWKVIENIHKAKIPHLLLTVDLVNENVPLTENGQHANFNPMLAPFNFPKPERHIPESHDQLDLDDLTDASVGPWKRRRTMALWGHEQLGEVLEARGKA